MNADGNVKEHRFFVLLFIKADLSAIALVLILTTADVQIDCLLKVIENINVSLENGKKEELLDPQSSTTKTGICNTDENMGNKAKLDTE